MTARSHFTLDYVCSKCAARDVKLWRGVHGAKNKDGHELLCATCLVPAFTVSDEGKLPLDATSGMSTDQVGGWLPAVPTGDTYWGYSSVPDADVRWWKALPTYPKATPSSGADRVRALLGGTSVTEAHLAAIGSVLADVRRETMLEVAADCDEEADGREDGETPCVETLRYIARRLRRTAHHERRWS